VLATTALLVAGGFVAVLLLEGRNPATLAPLPWPEKLLAALFHAVTPRTAGFHTLPMGAFTEAGLAVTVLLMFVGASPGSTGGGIKTTTLATVALTLRATFLNREDIEAFGRRIARDTADRAFVLATLGLALVMAVTLALTVAESVGFLPALFEATSAFATVGLSTGVTPELSPFGKVLLILTMFVGRVGPLTLGFALAGRERQPAALRFPEEKILIG
jgi:trk system potassium uptake protein TrkH